MDHLKVDIKLDEGASVPAYTRDGDAAVDLVATEALHLAPSERGSVGTGVRIAVPKGYVAQVLPRSGNAFKRGVTVVNAPGTIDSNYRGEIRVGLINHDAYEAFDVEPGDRVAQLLIVPAPVIDFNVVDELDETERGEAGFGSSGK